MLSPTSLSKSLAHTLGPELRVCILLTPQSRLIAYASSPPNAEDLMKVLLGLSAEAWRDAQTQAKLAVARLDNNSAQFEDEFVRLDSEVRVYLVLHIYHPADRENLVCFHPMYVCTNVTTYRLRTSLSIKSRNMSSWVEF